MVRIVVSIIVELSDPQVSMLQKFGAAMTSQACVCVHNSNTNTVLDSSENSLGRPQFLREASLVVSGQDSPHPPDPYISPNFAQCMGI
jgi:hypothetical protein